MPTKMLDHNNRAAQFLLHCRAFRFRWMMLVEILIEPFVDHVVGRRDAYGGQKAEDDICIVICDLMSAKQVSKYQSGWEKDVLGAVVETEESDVFGAVAFCLSSGIADAAGESEVITSSGAKRGQAPAKFTGFRDALVRISGEEDQGKIRKLPASLSAFVLPHRFPAETLGGSEEDKGKFGAPDKRVRRESLAICYQMLTRDGM